MEKSSQVVASLRFEVRESDDNPLQLERSVFLFLTEGVMVYGNSAYLSGNLSGEDFQGAAHVARSFLRMSKAWLEERFGKLKHDPWDDKKDTYLFVPAVSYRNGGSSIGAAMTGDDISRD